MKSHIFVVFCLYLGVYADVSNVCITPQWEGLVSLYTGTTEGDTPIFIQTLAHVHFDWNTSRVAVSASGSHDGHAFQRDYIFKYRENKVYTIEDGTCLMKYIGAGFPSLCVPHDFTFTYWLSWFGAMDGAEMVINGYQGDKNGINYAIQTMENGNWLVTTQQMIGRLNNVPFFQTTETMNATRGIKNTDAFVLPSNCKNPQFGGNFTFPAHLHGIFLP